MPSLEPRPHTREMQEEEPGDMTASTLHRHYARKPVRRPYSFLPTRAVYLEEKRKEKNGERDDTQPEGQVRAVECPGLPDPR